MCKCENCFCIDACREHYRVSESGIRKGNGCGCFVDSRKYAEVVHGRWLNKEVDEILYRVYGNCSVCRERKRIDNYCPNCGAKMDGDNNGRKAETI